MTEIIWLLLNDVQLDVSREVPIFDRVETLERFFPGRENMLPKIKQMPQSRFFKTHMPFWVMEKEMEAKKPRIVVMMRNPKDVVVSLYHFLKARTPDIVGSWEEYIECVKAKKMVFGDWFDHVLGYWTNKDKPNFLFLMYEDMKADLYREVQKVENFLGMSLTEENREKLVQAVSFKSMKENPGTNLSNWKWEDASVVKLQRKGIVGDWKNLLTEDQSSYFDRRYKEEIGGSGLEFRFQ